MRQVPKYFQISIFMSLPSNFTWEIKLLEINSQVHRHWINIWCRPIWLRPYLFEQSIWWNVNSNTCGFKTLSLLVVLNCVKYFTSSCENLESVENNWFNDEGQSYDDSLKTNFLKSSRWNLTRQIKLEIFISLSACLPVLLFSP